MYAIVDISPSQLTKIIGILENTYNIQYFIINRGTLRNMLGSGPNGLLRNDVVYTKSQKTGGVPAEVPSRSLLISSLYRIS